MVQLEDLRKLAQSEPVPEPKYKQEKQGLLSKYEIPIHHLDFDYVKTCQDAKELEKIYRILKSGEEGYFPDLQKATEDKLRLLKPNSKVLRDVCPVLTRNEMSKEEWNDLTDDLKGWMTDVKRKDKELDERKVKEVNCTVEIRKSREERKATFKPPNDTRIKSTDYDSWDKYDPDTEILKMDLQDEKVKKEALEKQDKKKKSKMVRFSNFATEAEALYEANSEKERGNECFKAREYENALQHYSYSIQCKPLAAAYTNRAIVHIKLRRYQLAIQDCQEALKLDPKSFKAYLRMAQSYESLQNYSEALEKIKNAITLDPNNIVAQELANRLYKLCGEPTICKKTRFAIEDVEVSKKCFTETPTTKPLKPILKSPSKKGEVIAIPGSSKMPPPYYKVVNSTDPEVIRKERQKILCKPGLLHMTTIDTGSDDEIENEQKAEEQTRNDQDEAIAEDLVNFNLVGKGFDIITETKNKSQREGKSVATETIIEELVNLNTDDEASMFDGELANTEEIKVLTSVSPEKQPSQSTMQTQKGEDKGAGGEPHNQEESEIDSFIEDIQSPYTFTKAWNSARKDFTYTKQAEILRNVNFNRIHEVIGFNMDADMLSGIIHCLHKHFMIPSELDRLRLALTNLNRIPRFQMTLLFLSNAERTCIKQLIEFLDQHERYLPNNVRDIYSN